jgi:hypothetical protein
MYATTCSLGARWQCAASRWKGLPSRRLAKLTRWGVIARQPTHEPQISTSTTFPTRSSCVILAPYQ